ncbi:MAG: hypothetical protein MR288_04420, partial [Firmicutes bacterium]|nr:hypothetical protein [Bacillota bacterium]
NVNYIGRFGSVTNLSYQFVSANQDVNELLNKRYKRTAWEVQAPQNQVASSRDNYVYIDIDITGVSIETPYLDHQLDIKALFERYYRLELSKPLFFTITKDFEIESEDEIYSVIDKDRYLLSTPSDPANYNNGYYRVNSIYGVSINYLTQYQTNEEIPYTFVGWFNYDETTNKLTQLTTSTDMTIDRNDSLNESMETLRVETDTLIVPVFAEKHFLYWFEIPDNGLSSFENIALNTKSVSSLSGYYTNSYLNDTYKLYDMSGNEFISSAYGEISTKLNELGTTIESLDAIDQYYYIAGTFTKVHLKATPTEDFRIVSWLDESSSYNTRVDPTQPTTGPSNYYIDGFRDKSGNFEENSSARFAGKITLKMQGIAKIELKAAYSNASGTLNDFAENLDATSSIKYNYGNIYNHSQIINNNVANGVSTVFFDSQYDGASGFKNNNIYTNGVILKTDNGEPAISLYVNKYLTTNNSNIRYVFDHFVHIRTFRGVDYESVLTYTTSGTTTNSVNAEYTINYYKNEQNIDYVRMTFIPRVKTGADQTQVTNGKYIAVYKKVFKTVHNPFMMNYSITGEDLKTTTLNTGMNTLISVEYDTNTQSYLVRDDSNTGKFEGNSLTLEFVEGTKLKLKSTYSSTANVGYSFRQIVLPNTNKATVVNQNVNDLTASMETTITLDSNDDAGQYEYDYRRVLFYNFSILPDSSAASVYTLATPTGTHLLNIKERFSTTLSRYLTLEGETISFVLTPKIENNVPKYVFKQFSKSYASDINNRSKITNGSGNPPYSVTSSGVTESIQDLEWDNLTFVSSLNSCFKDGTIGQDTINYYAEYDRLLQVSFGVDRSLDKAKQLLQLDGVATKIISNVAKKCLILDASSDASKLEEASPGYTLVFKMLVKEGGDVKVNISTNQPNIYRIKQWSTLASGIITSDSKVVVNNTTNNTDFGEAVVTSSSSDTAHTGFGITTMSITNMTTDATAQYIAEIVKTYTISAPQYITGYTTKGINQQGGKVGDDSQPYIITGNQVLSPNGYRYDDGLEVTYTYELYDGYNFKGFIINEPTNPAGNNIVSGAIVDDAEFVLKLRNESKFIFTESIILPDGSDSNLILDKDISSIYFVYREIQYDINHNYVFTGKSLSTDNLEPGTYPETIYLPTNNYSDFENMINSYYVIGYFGTYTIKSVKGENNTYIAKYFGSNNVLFDSQKSLTKDMFDDSNTILASNFISDTTKDDDKTGDITGPTEDETIESKIYYLKSTLLEGDLFTPKDLDNYYNVDENDDIKFASMLNSTVNIITWLISVDRYTFTSAICNGINDGNYDNMVELLNINTFTSDPMYTSLPGSNAYVIESGSKVTMTTIYTRFNDTETVLGANGVYYNYKNIEFVGLYRQNIEDDGEDNEVITYSVALVSYNYDYANGLVTLIIESSSPSTAGNLVAIYRQRELVDVKYSMLNGTKVNDGDNLQHEMKVTGNIITTDYLTYDGSGISEADFIRILTEASYGNGSQFWVYVGEEMSFSLEPTVDTITKYRPAKLIATALDYVAKDGEENPQTFVRTKQIHNERYALIVDSYTYFETYETDIEVVFALSKTIRFVMDTQYQKRNLEIQSAITIEQTLISGDVDINYENDIITIDIEEGSILTIKSNDFIPQSDNNYRYNYLKLNGVKQTDWNIYNQQLDITNVLDESTYSFNFIEVFLYTFNSNPPGATVFNYSASASNTLINDGISLTPYLPYKTVDNEGDKYFDYQVTVALTVSLATNYNFAGWEVDKTGKPYLITGQGIVTSSTESTITKYIDKNWDFIAHFEAEGSELNIFGNGSASINGSDNLITSTPYKFQPSNEIVTIKAIPGSDTSVVIDNCFFRYLKDGKYNYYTIDTDDSEGNPSLTIVRNSDGSVEFTYNNEDLYYVECYLEFKSKSWAMEEFVSTPVGDGTINNPYIIDSPNKLAYIARSLSATNRASSNPTLNKYYKLTQNIDLSDHYWFPIGTRQTGGWPFSGYFDGNG